MPEKLLRALLNTKMNKLFSLQNILKAGLLMLFLAVCAIAEEDTSIPVTQAKPIILPDLIFSQEVSSEGELLEGGNLLLNGQVTNEAQAYTAASGLEVSIFLNGSLLKSDNTSIPSLSPMQSFSFKYQIGPLQPGNYRVTFNVDPENLVKEKREKNNLFEKSFTVEAKPKEFPDFKFGKKPEIAEAVFSGEKIILKGDVLNDSLYDAQYGMSVKMTVTRNNETMHSKSKSLEKIAAGEKLPFSFTFTANKAGPYTVSIILDPQDSIQELYESNNSYELSFSAKDNPLDLAAAKITLSPEAPQDNGSVTIKTSAVNNGSSAVTGAVLNLEVLQNGKSLKKWTETIKTIKAGGKHSVSQTLEKLAPGKYSVKANIQPASGAKDAMSANNTQETDFSILSDLQCMKITITPAKPKKHDSIRVVTTISNSGAARAQRVSGQITVLRDGKAVSHWPIEQVAELKPGKIFKTANVLTDLTGTNYEIAVLVDAKNAIAESNEDNNKKTVKFTTA